jgi:hypothetical protein
VAILNIRLDIVRFSLLSGLLKYKGAKSLGPGYWILRIEKQEESLFSQHDNTQYPTPNETPFE